MFDPAALVSKIKKARKGCISKSNQSLWHTVVESDTSALKEFTEN